MSDEASDALTVTLSLEDAKTVKAVLGEEWRSPSPRVYPRDRDAIARAISALKDTIVLGSAIVRGEAMVAAKEGVDGE